LKVLSRDQQVSQLYSFFSWFVKIWPVMCQHRMLFIST